MRKLLVIMSLVIPFTGCSQKTFEEMVDGLVSKKVPLMYVNDLNAKLEAGENIVVLDAREEGEFNVSHIEDARFCGHKEFDKKAVNGVDKSATIVVYCSVGYRSGKIGERLQKMGYSKVYNLYGGIFEWVNSGYPVYTTEGIKTEKIHGYSEKWGKWLRRGEKVYK